MTPLCVLLFQALEASPAGVLKALVWRGRDKDTQGPVKAGLSGIFMDLCVFLTWFLEREFVVCFVGCLSWRRLMQEKLPDKPISTLFFSFPGF